MRFASADFDVENENQKLPSLSLFLGRVFLNDFLSIGILRIADVFIYAILFTILLRLGGDLLVSAFVALILTELILMLTCIAVKKLLVGSRWGLDHSAPFWSWRHFTYFFAQDCFFAWCRIPMGFLAGTLPANIMLRKMGCRIGKRTIIGSPMQAFDWNAVNFGDDCIIEGALQFHTFENMTLKVKQTEVQDGCSINFGATLMGGVVVEPGTTILPLSLTLKEMHLTTGTYWGSPTELVGNA